MITFALFSALATFYFTMFITPGPNNAMLTASGNRNSTWSYIPNRVNLFWFSKFIFNLSSGSILYENFMFFIFTLPS